jgi:hypothetical protein
MAIAYVTFCDVEHIECKLPSVVDCETKVGVSGKKFSHTGTDFPGQRPSLAPRIPEAQQP